LLELETLKEYTFKSICKVYISLKDARRFARDTSI